MSKPMALLFDIPMKRHYPLHLLLASTSDSYPTQVWRCMKISPFLILPSHWLLPNTIPNLYSYGSPLLRHGTCPTAAIFRIATKMRTCFLFILCAALCLANDEIYEMGTLEHPKENLPFNDDVTVKTLVMLLLIHNP